MTLRNSSESSRSSRGAGGRHLLAIALVFACSLVAGSVYGEEETNLKIGSIEIIANDVFTGQEAGRGRAYSVTNTLHIKTRDGVIRDFLLFREGDPYVPSLLAESERILRSKRFFASASVTSGQPHDGVVDVVVVTQDSWSTQPGGTVGSAGGQTDYSFAIEENNFLGFGKQVTMYYASDVERTGLGVRYEDTALFGSRWNADVLFANNSDGTQLELNVGRPFFSFATPWSVSGGVTDRELTSRVYADGAVAGEFDHKRQAVNASYGLALSPGDEQAHRISFGVDWQSDDFTPFAVGPTVSVPENRDYRYLFANYELVKNDFAKVNYLDRDQRYEDLRIGTRINLRAGISPGLFGVDKTTGMVSAELSKGFELGHVILLTGASLETRIGADNSNRVAAGELRAIRQYSGLTHPQTTVGRIAVAYGQDLDSDLQFFADGSTGLRGYRLYSYAGDSSIILNLEHRMFLGRELWQFLSPGVAFFVDAGNAGYGSDVFKPGNLKVDVGVGLRLGMTRTASRTFRLDVAYSLDPDPFGRTGWLVSFSSGQAF